MESFFEKLAARPQRTILILSLALLLAGNWILPLTDRDETRFAEASREMIQRHDFVVPWFNGAWRFDKPVLIYWCQIASYEIFGENNFAARLPSVLFTTATALLLVRWGKKISGNKTGFLAGAIFVTGLHIAIIGRVATADMAMVFFFTLAVWSGWELTRPENSARKIYWLIFYVALALGFLAKGPVADLPLAGLFLCRVLRRNSFRLPLLETIAGIIFASFLGLLWGIPAMLQTHGQFFKIGIGEHVLFRSVGVIDNHGPKTMLKYLLELPLYLGSFLISFLPWTIRRPKEVETWLLKLKQKGKFWSLLAFILWLLFFILYIPIKIYRWWPDKNRDDLGWYLLIQTAIVFVIFSLVRTKLPHYTIPAFPLISLWFARQIATEKNSFAWFDKRFLAMVVFIFVLTLGIFPIAKNYLLTENLWRAVKSHVQPQTKIGCFGYTEPSLVWKFRGMSTNLVTLGDEKSARNFLTNSPPFILVLPTKDLSTLSDTNEILIHVHGLDMVKFKNWDLTAIVRP